MDDEREIMKRRYEEPFTVPKYMDADQRVPYALEYIAYQLGQINRKLDTLINMHR